MRAHDHFDPKAKAMRGTIFLAFMICACLTLAGAVGSALETHHTVKIASL